MRAWKFIEKNFEKWFLIISLVAMVLIIFMQVVLRWFHAATVWAEELARYIMLYQVWNRRVLRRPRGRPHPYHRADRQAHRQ